MGKIKLAPDKREGYIYVKSSLICCKKGLLVQKNKLLQLWILYVIHQNITCHVLTWATEMRWELRDIFLSLWHLKKFKWEKYNWPLKKREEYIHIKSSLICCKKGLLVQKNTLLQLWILYVIHRNITCHVLTWAFEMKWELCDIFLSLWHLKKFKWEKYNWTLKKERHIFM